jgi:hypothetical protein
MEWAMARTGGGGRGEGLGLWAGDSARTTFSHCTCLICGARTKAGKWKKVAKT